MNSPLVSIVIPNYNNKELLQEMIACIRNQSYANWELLVIDDGSTDGSYEEVERMSLEDNRIRSVKRDRLPKGGQTCRNLGYSLSNGKYVIFFDSDDLIASYCIEQRVQFMEKNGDVDYGIFPAYSFKNGDDPFVKTKRSVVFGKTEVTDPLLSFLRNEYPHTVWTNIYRRDSIKDIHWDDKVLVRQDFDFNVSNLLAGSRWKFGKDAKFDYFYRGAFGANNVSKNFTSHDKCESMIYLFGKILDKLNCEEVSKRKKYENALKQYFVHHYTILLKKASKEDCCRFLGFCNDRCSKSFVYKMKLAQKVTQHLPHFKRSLFIDVLVFSLFRNRFYFVQLRRKVSQLFN